MNRVGRGGRCAMEEEKNDAADEQWYRTSSCAS